MNCPFCATGQSGLTRTLRRGDRGPGGPRCSERCGRRRGRPRQKRRNGVEDRVHGHGGGPGQLQGHRWGRSTTIHPSPDGLGIPARVYHVPIAGRVPDPEVTLEKLPITPAASSSRPDDELRDASHSDQHTLEGGRGPLTPPGTTTTPRPARVQSNMPIRTSTTRAGVRTCWAEADKRGGGGVHANPIPLNPTPGSKWTASRPGRGAELRGAPARPRIPPRCATPAGRTSTARAELATGTS
ncbi:hypothetical protein QJS66_20520 [Kocuria rhizophila]|nr:hypothetical protein QJS66_20520 [Kocuria rhizophila]